MDNTSPSSTHGNSRRSKNSQEKKNERYRRHINQKSDLDIQYILNKAREGAPYELISRGKRAFMDGDLDEFNKVKFMLDNPNMSVSLSPCPDNENEINPYSITEVVLKNSSSLDGRCDPAECDSCTPLSSDAQITVHASSVVIYAGPGSGKTEVIKTVPKAYRGNVFDTDHCKAGQKIPPRSLVFTNRPDIAKQHADKGLAIAFLPFLRHWMKLCLTKCPDARQSWFADARAALQGVMTVRRNSYLSDVLRIRCAHGRKSCVSR